MDIKDIKPNPNNPRIIKDDKYKKLLNSIKEFPKMLELRPIVVDKNNMILGGNMRYKACKELGIKEVPVKIAEDLTPEEEQRFIIEDNVGFGDWDIDMLANEWNSEDLVEWGVDISSFEEIEEELDKKYSDNIASPIYEITGEKPNIEEIYNSKKTKSLIDKINKSKASNEIKEFLINASYRHTEINYEKVAEYYANSSKEIQELFEENALVIIDYNKAIENGLVTLSKKLLELNTLKYE